MSEHFTSTKIVHRGFSQYVYLSEEHLKHVPPVKPENLTDIENRGARFVPRKNAGVNASLLKIEITVRRGIAEYRLIAFYGQDSSSSSGSDGARRTGGASSGGSSASRPQGSGGNAGDSSGVLASQSSRSASTKGSASLKILKIYERGMLQ